MKQLIQIIKFIDQHPLARKHKLRAYCNFLWWQLSQFFSPRTRVVQFVGKTKLVVKKGLTGATGNIYTGLHEFSDMAFLLHLLRKQDLFYDIGANVGSYTVLASGYIGAHSVSFEPIPSTFEWLQKNIETNKIKTSAKAMNIGLGSQKQNLYFTSDYDTVNHVVAETEHQSTTALIEVKVEDFDSIANKEGMPLLIKIDVEGFETEVLNGMKQALANNHIKAIIIELNGSGERYGFDEKLIHQKLLDNHFLPYQYDPFKRKLIQLEHFGSTNTIYIRDLDFVQNRVENADKISLFSESF